MKTFVRSLFAFAFMLSVAGSSSIVYAICCSGSANCGGWTCGPADGECRIGTQNRVSSQGTISFKAGLEGCADFYEWDSATMRCKELTSGKCGTPRAVVC